MINSNRITDSRKKINKLNNKYKKEYLFKKKIGIFSITLIIIFFIFAFSNNFFKDSSEFDENNIVNLNSKKFKEEIISLYERDGEKDKFVNYMQDLENSIAIYLIDNTTSNNNSFEKLVKDTENKLNSNDWSSLNISKNIYYKGKYILNDKGNLSFKFDKTIEPIWTKDLNKFIILN